MTFNPEIDFGSPVMRAKGTKIDYSDIQTGDIIEYTLDEGKTVTRCVAYRLSSAHVSFYNEYNNHSMILPRFKDLEKEEENQFFLLGKAISEPKGFGAVVKVNGRRFVQLLRGPNSVETWHSEGKIYLTIGWSSIIENDYEILSYGAE